VLLLLWKTLLLSLGGIQKLKDTKSSYRQRSGLNPITDDTLEVTRTMRAASPPASATDLIEAQQQRKMNRPFKRQTVIKQSSMIGDESVSYQDFDANNESNDEEMIRPPNAAIPMNEMNDMMADLPQINKGLPWVPKVRQKDIDSFLDHTRLKFVGYVLPNDRTTTAGLPEPILESISILERHIYVSLSEAQMKREEELNKYPLTVKELDELPLSSSAETLYQAMLPSLPQYMIALLKILLAAAPTSKAKTDSPNIMADVLPEEMPMTVLQSMKLGIDVNRHKEIIIKAVSAILLLLLKHYKLNHKWVPKVRQKDIDSFLDHTRLKFVGYVLPNDRTTTAGLPEPILESISILERHIYVSLSEAQMKREEELNKYPLTVKELDELPLSSSTETLYQAMLPSLPQYMIALLKILLAAAPTSKAKTDSPNIMADVLPEEMPMTVLQSMKLGIDVNRHKEIIIKAVSAILLLLLKHYKLNHIYQFEYISQQLMFANCIPLVLKFFNQNISAYITAKNTISVIDFPACVIGEQPELTADTLEFGETQAYCWRNMFSCINLLRILNKLTKWKHSRIMMLVVFKSAPILKRALKVRHAMLQLYVLKLLKMQAKYLGRQWRKSNMKTMSAIYQKVRHRLNDDWAYGNDLDARPWDFQAEEFTLQANINRFHNRRYEKQCTTGVSQSQLLSNSSVNSNPNSTNSMSLDAMSADILQPVDNNFLSILSRDIELTKEFKYNYETWLEREVFQFTVDWDQLLSATNTVSM
ncbi:unnamed protein product, partial [Oppiella nova]